MKPEELSDWATLEKYCKPAFDFLLATSDAIDRQHQADWSRIGRMHKAWSPRLTTRTIFSALWLRAE